MKLNTMLENARFSDTSYDTSQRKRRWSLDTTWSETASLNLFQQLSRLTTPAEPSVSASFITRENYRRACLFSNVAFFLIAILVFSAPLCLLLPSPAILYIDCAEIVISSTCLIFNRRARTFIASIVQVVSFEMALTCVLLIMTPATSANPQILDLFIIGELLAAALLPTRYVFLVTFYNSLFIWLYTSYQVSTPNTILSSFIVIGLQFMIAGISAIWVYNTTQAIRRADKAEIVATLGYTLAEQRKELEAGIERILQTHIAVANGNLNARVQLAQGHMLRHIACALNSLLVRFQHASVAEKELQRTELAVTNTVNIIQKAAQQHQQVRIPFTQTSIDSLIATIQGKTFAFTKPLRQQNTSGSTKTANAYTISAKISPCHAPP